MKILILVQSVDIDRYPELTKAQQETWDSIKHPDIEVLYYYPITTTKRGIDGNKLYIGGSNHWSYMFVNTIRAFREVMSLEWDFILKTDSTSYVNKEQLVKVMTGKPTTQYYGGHLCETPPEGMTTQFLFGGGYLLSKDVVATLIDVYASNPTKRAGYDDCHVGNILTDKFEWDVSLEMCPYDPEVPIPTCHLYRCSNPKLGAKPFDDEISAINAIHKHITNG
jgi:hypothetical protein